MEGVKHTIEIEDEDLDELDMYCPLRPAPGRERKRAANHHWSSDDDRRLRALWGNVTLVQLARELRVTLRQVTYRGRTVLRLPSRPARRTCR